MLPHKSVLANELLKESSVLFHLDPQRDAFDCKLPLHLKLQRHVVLHFGHNMPVPIPDLRVDLRGIGGTLSFGGTPYTCWIPWECVLVICTPEGRGLVYEWPAHLTAPKQTCNVVSLADFKRRRKA